MVSAQAGLFGLLEATEQVRAGQRAFSVFADSSFRWGVAAQLVCAAVLLAVVWLARFSGERVRALVSRRRPWPTVARRKTWAALTAVVALAVWVAAVSERGPPRPLALV